MQNLKQQLNQRLNNATKVCVLGVGSEMRSDDAAGVLAAQQLEKVSSKKLVSMVGHTAPENFSGQIKREKPSHLIVIDSADFGGKPGDIRFITREEMSGFTFSTHSMPLKIMLKLLDMDIKYETVIIGIQPKSFGFGEPPSEEVSEAVKEVAEAINSVLNV